eukprot:gnl/TRDRNA2_/TRDRNA2_37928_c0_seq1.p1 gnl/TRDRNA2_/TRDRNA2_37928_c0~~gnl/TRDRNA2_/TRDRNA2_37928_c0_seq1.p1  ORF type:complete len:603 (-),score=146.34 gnl/TRDRNA2_/TRDRNA2_37928_c0_seq1:52-1818(-)
MTAEKKKVSIKKAVADQVRWLNSEGQLAAPLRIGAIAEPLSLLEETAALEVLSELLNQEDCADPTAWVASAARKAAAGGVKEEEVEDVATATASQPSRKRKRQHEAGPELSQDILEYIKDLNASGILNTAIEEKGVRQPFTLVDKRTMMRILRIVENANESILTTTEWIAQGARNEAGKVMERILLLNKSEVLAAPIDCQRVRGPLSMLTEATALKILKDVRDRADEEEDPTGHIVAAANKSASKVARRMQKLNDDLSIAMEKSIRIGEVCEIFTDVPEDVIDSILRGLLRMTKNQEVKDPTTWIGSRVRAYWDDPEAFRLEMESKGKGKGKDKGKGKSKDKGKGSFKGVAKSNTKSQSNLTGKGNIPGKGKSSGKGDTSSLTASQTKIFKRIGYLNKTAGLQKEIDFWSVKPSLDCVDEKTQLKILEHLVEKADQLANPSSWIRHQCRVKQARHEEIQAQRRQERKGAKGKGKGKGGKGKGKRKGKVQDEAGDGAAEAGAEEEGEGELPPEEWAEEGEQFAEDEAAAEEDYAGEEEWAEGVKEEIKEEFGDEAAEAEDRDEALAEFEAGEEDEDAAYWGTEVGSEAA